MNIQQPQTLRFTRPPPTPKATPTRPRHTGLLQDKLRRSARRIWCPSFSAAFRILLFARFTAAMYSNIQDCDEVYNFWEPLHFLMNGYGFQTWEVSPQFAIRSWAYILLHIIPASLPIRLLRLDKRQSFFAVRIAYAFVASFCEARFFRTVVDRINDRVGRYMLFMLLLSAGMWNASTAFLPSTFAMHTNLLAFSYAFQLPSLFNTRRTLLATFYFALGAIVGWPFALLLSVPFVLEELFVGGADRTPETVRKAWMLSRWKRFYTAAATAAIIFIPVIAIDSLAYGKVAIVSWNIIRYNIFGGKDRGPELYGTEPWYFYLLNLSLAFNILTPLALLSPFALFITYFIDHQRLGIIKPGPDQSSPYTLMFIRLAPFCLWFLVLSGQPHKEERFMYPAYPLICFNAAVTLYLSRGWLEVGYIKLTSSPYQASQSRVFRRTTRLVVVLAGLVSICRIVALYHYYHAPLDVASYLEAVELPRLLNVTGLLLPAPPSTNTKYDKERSVDLSPLQHFKGLRLCLGKEWYRFPGHFLVPRGVEVKFLKSGFDGLLPRHFDVSDFGHFDNAKKTQGVWKWPQTRIIPDDLNDKNQEDLSRYVEVGSCDYILDLDFPSYPSSNTHEPRYAIQSDAWDRIFCAPFLDGRHSAMLTRTVWLPLKWWQDQNSYGDYCLLRNIGRATARESKIWVVDE